MSIHKLITPREIAKLHEKWCNLYKANNDNGNLVASFIAGEQWDSSTKDTRQNAGKEVLTLNLAIKHLHRIIADYMSVDYILKSHSNKVVKDEQYIRNVDELLEHFILKNSTDELVAAFEQLVIRGYSVFEVTAEYVNKNSYQLVPVLKHVAKPEMVFFDSDAALPTKMDARFCGKASMVHEETLKKLYPKYKGKGFNRYQDEVFSESNKVKVYDFYFKEDEKVKFYKIGNKFKPEHKLTGYEKQNLGGVEYFEKLLPMIYTCRCTDDDFLTKPTELYGMHNLPYVFIGQPMYIKLDDQYKQIIIPYLAPLIDAQQMLNNAASQIATQTTKKLERSVIIDKSGIDEKDINAWQNFNVASGVFPWKGTNEMGQPNTAPIVLEPSNLDTSLLQLMQLSKVMIDEVMGINLSQQGSDEDGAQSGVALAQRIAQGDLVQKRFLHIFIKALNQAGQVIKEMLAALITDEFEFMLNDKFVKINELSLSSLPDDPVRQTSFERLHEEYDFTIEASPSSQLEKMRSRETYLTIARTLPQYAPYFIDLLFENLDVNNSTEVVKRFKTMIDPLLLAVGKGEITTEQYYEEMQKRAQQQQQKPDTATALLQMEAQNNQMKAQLKAKELEQNFVIEKDKLVMEQAKLLSSEKKEENKDAIKLLEVQARNLEREYMPEAKTEVVSLDVTATPWDSQYNTSPVVINMVTDTKGRLLSVPVPKKIYTFFDYSFPLASENVTMLAIMRANKSQGTYNEAFRVNQFISDYAVITTLHKPAPWDPGDGLCTITIFRIDELTHTAFSVTALFNTDDGEPLLNPNFMNRGDFSYAQNSADQCAFIDDNALLWYFEVSSDVTTGAQKVNYNKARFQYLDPTSPIEWGLLGSVGSDEQPVGSNAIEPTDITGEIDYRTLFDLTADNRQLAVTLQDYGIVYHAAQGLFYFTEVGDFSKILFEFEEWPQYNGSSANPYDPTKFDPVNGGQLGTPLTQWAPGRVIDMVGINSTLYVFTQDNIFRANLVTVNDNPVLQFDTTFNMHYKIRLNSNALVYQNAMYFTTEDNKIYVLTTKGLITELTDRKLPDKYHFTFNQFDVNGSLLDFFPARVLLPVKIFNMNCILENSTLLNLDTKNFSFLIANQNLQVSWEASETQTCTYDQPKRITASNDIGTYVALQNVFLYMPGEFDNSISNVEDNTDYFSEGLVIFEPYIFQGKTKGTLAGISISFTDSNFDPALLEDFDAITLGIYIITDNIYAPDLIDNLYDDTWWEPYNKTFNRKFSTNIFTAAFDIHCQSFIVCIRFSPFTGPGTITPIFELQKFATNNIMFNLMQ